MDESRNGGGSAQEMHTATEEPASGAPETPAAQQLDPAILARIAELRTHVREAFGKTVMAMMMLARYRNQTLADLQHLVLEPLIRDRIAIAYPGDKDASPANDIAGLAIWASVSEEVDARIREQIKAGTFPVRLKPEDWTSGDRNWLLDVIAPDKRSTASVIANFKQVVKQGSLRLHPMVTRLLDEETLRKMGAEKFTDTPVQPEAEAVPEGETIN